MRSINGRDGKVSTPPPSRLTRDKSRKIVNKTEVTIAVVSYSETQDNMSLASLGV